MVILMIMMYTIARLWETTLVLQNLAIDYIRRRLHFRYLTILDPLIYLSYHHLERTREAVVSGI